MPKFKIRMLRGKVIQGTPSRGVPKGVIEIDTDDPKQKDLWHLVDLAQTGATHLGRRVAEFVVDGPLKSFSGADLDMLRLAPVSAYPGIAVALAEQIGTTPELAARQLAQALDVPVELFATSAGYHFSPDEIANLKQASIDQQPSIAKEFAAYAKVSLEEAGKLLSDATGMEWAIAPAPEALTAEEPPAKKNKKGE